MRTIRLTRRLTATTAVGAALAAALVVTPARAGNHLRFGHVVLLEIHLGAEIAIPILFRLRLGAGDVRILRPGRVGGHRGIRPRRRQVLAGRQH